jgi:hypothetical protein
MNFQIPVVCVYETKDSHIVSKSTSVTQQNAKKFHFGNDGVVLYCFLTLDNFDACCDHPCKNRCTSKGCPQVFTWCTVMFCMLPPIVFFFFLLANFVIIWLPILSPPLLILVQSMPWFRSKKWHVFEIFEKDKLENRADQETKGHVSSFWNRGHVRAFLLCLGLTCLGWIPGVIFAYGMVVRHIYKICKDECC